MYERVREIAGIIQFSVYLISNVDFTGETTWLAPQMMPIAKY